jgi:hypothetical protein
VDPNAVAVAPVYDLVNVHVPVLARRLPKKSNARGTLTTSLALLGDERGPPLETGSPYTWRRWLSSVLITLR